MAHRLADVGPFDPAAGPARKRGPRASPPLGMERGPLAVGLGSYTAECRLSPLCNARMLSTHSILGLRR